MRLAKYLARAGVASRRGAETMISEGRVKVNGTIVNKPQLIVGEGDEIMVDGSLIESFEDKVYILLNKPAGYISTAHDTHNRPTVIDLVSDVKARLYPVGRLDADTSGVLLMTNDGKLAYRLMHPRYEVKKVYQARVSGLVSNETLKQMSSGLIINSEKTAPAIVKKIKAVSNKDTLLAITLTEGKKRQVKMMCAAVGHRVKELKRVSFAGLTAANIPRGSHRHLNKQEIDHLYRIVGL